LTLILPVILGLIAALAMNERFWPEAVGQHRWPVLPASSDQLDQNLHSRLGSIQALDPMMRRLPFAVTLLALIGQPALASQTVCTFSSGEVPRYYELEFIGYGNTNPTIVFSSTTFESGKRITLHPSNYSLEQFSPKARSVSLEFRNPKDLAQPPSFNLNGAGGRAILIIGSSIVEGDLECDY